MSHLIFLLDFPKFSVQEAAGFPALFQQLRFHLPSILSQGREMIDISGYLTNKPYSGTLTKRPNIFFNQTPVIQPTASLLNRNCNLYNLVQFYHVNKATGISCVHLSIIILFLLRLVFKSQLFYIYNFISKAIKNHLFRSSWSYNFDVCPDVP